MGEPGRHRGAVEKCSQPLKHDTPSPGIGSARQGTADPLVRSRRAVAKRRVNRPTKSW
jgi:hypothetical protein